MAQTVEIDTDRIGQIVEACLCPPTHRETSLRGKVVQVYGINLNPRFDPDALEEHQPEINRMLDQLPPQFHPGRGGGDSPMHMFGFGAPVDVAVVEQLLCMGLAIGRLRCVTSRSEARQTADGLQYVKLNW